MFMLPDNLCCPLTNLIGHNISFTNFLDHALHDRGIANFAACTATVRLEYALVQRRANGKPIA